MITGKFVKGFLIGLGLLFLSAIIGIIIDLYISGTVYAFDGSDIPEEVGAGFTFWCMTLALMVYIIFKYGLTKLWLISGFLLGIFALKGGDQGVAVIGALILASLIGNLVLKFKLPKVWVIFGLLFNYILIPFLFGTLESNNEIPKKKV